MTARRAAFGDSARLPAGVGAWMSTRSGGSGWVSSRYSMIAIDCPSAWPSSVSSVGTSTDGDSAVYAGCWCSPLTRCTDW